MSGTVEQLVSELAQVRRDLEAEFNMRLRLLNQWISEEKHLPVDEYTALLEKMLCSVTDKYIELTNIKEANNCLKDDLEAEREKVRIMKEALGRIANHIWLGSPSCNGCKLSSTIAIETLEKVK
jgi:endonuclease III-like uncharacterized protein